MRHTYDRYFEWAVSAIMLQMGLGTFFAQIFGYKVIGAFNVLLQLGLSLLEVGMLFVLTGALRLIALYANGHWKHGIYFRITGCFVGVLVWSQMAIGILEVLLTTDSMFMVLYVWTTFALFELFSLCRSVADMKRGMLSNAKPA